MKDYIAQIASIIKRPDMGVAKAAKAIGISRAYLNETLRGSRRISVPLAFKLQKEFPSIDGLNILLMQTTEEWRSYTERYANRKD